MNCQNRKLVMLLKAFGDHISIAIVIVLSKTFHIPLSNNRAELL